MSDLSIAPDARTDNVLVYDKERDLVRAPRHGDELLSKGGAFTARWSSFCSGWTICRHTRERYTLARPHESIRRLFQPPLVGELLSYDPTAKPGEVPWKLPEKANRRDSAEAIQELQCEMGKRWLDKIAKEPPPVKLPQAFVGTFFELDDGTFVKPDDPPAALKPATPAYHRCGNKDCRNPHCPRLDAMTLEQLQELHYDASREALKQLRPAPGVYTPEFFAALASAIAEKKQV